MTLPVFAVAVILALFVFAVGVGRYLSRRQGEVVRKPSPCFRCGYLSTTDYMGLRYCRMCRDVVNAMIGSVRHDPPYGFPGAEGYTEFPPPPEIKKER